MKKKKKLKKIISVIILVIIMTTNILIGKKLQTKNINLEQMVNNTIPIIEKQKEEKEQEETNEIPNNYLGYIIIPKYNIKKLIKLGTENYILNQNIVGLYNNGNHLNSKEGQIILAGHNNKDVFKNIAKLKINDNIKIITVDKTNIYKVTKTKIISINDYNDFVNYKKEKELVLITCMSKNTRLLVFAKEKTE